MNPIVTLTLENNVEFKIELYPEHAPQSVNNFISLINKGYYNGIIFHRIVKNFVMQGGDPTGTGTGGPGYAIKGEFKTNGIDNPIEHTLGTLSMARSASYNSGGSQFFICTADASFLNNDYAGFGRVITGLENLPYFNEIEVGFGDRPVEEVKIKEMTVDTKGITYEEPIKL